MRFKCRGQKIFAHKNDAFFILLVTFGSWFDHIKGWLTAEDKHPIMYISYEEMIMVSLYSLYILV